MYVCMCVSDYICQILSHSDTELLDESYSLYGVKLPPPGGPRAVPAPRTQFPTAPTAVPYDATRYVSLLTILLAIRRAETPGGAFTTYSLCTLSTSCCCCYCYWCYCYCMLYVLYSTLSPIYSLCTDICSQYCSHASSDGDNPPLLQAKASNSNEF